MTARSSSNYGGWRLVLKCYNHWSSAVHPSSPNSGFSHVGTWLSLVEHSLGVRGVGSSNLPVPTIHFVARIGTALKHECLACRPRSTPKLRSGRADAPNKSMRGALRSSRSAVQICPSRPFLSCDIVEAFAFFLVRDPSASLGFRPSTTLRAGSAGSRFAHARKTAQVQICPSRPFHSQFATRMIPMSQASVGLSASGRTVIRFGQQTVTVVRRVFVRGNWIIGEILPPVLTPSVISVILEVELVIFLAAATKHLDMPCRIRSRRQHLGFLTQ